MKAKQLALFPENIVYGYGYSCGCDSVEAPEVQPTETVEQQDETLDGGDDQ